MMEGPASDVLSLALLILALIHLGKSVRRDLNEALIKREVNNEIENKIIYSYSPAYSISKTEPRIRKYNC